MFQEETLEPVSVQSFVEKESTQVNGEIQTVPCAYENVNVQVGCVSNAETQTDPAITSAPPQVSFNEARLASFLTRICPKVLEELDKAHNSRAFDRYSGGDFEDGNKTRKLHTLQPSCGLPIECKLNCLIWSCSGAVIALGYGSNHHDGWCDHRSKILLFNINRPNFSSTVPSQTLETKSCVTCISGHPSESSIIAAGLFSGEVLVWNMQWEEDCLLGSSETVGGGHEDAIIKAEWVSDPFKSSDAGPSRLALATAGLDGRLILWRLASQTGGLRRGQGFGVTGSHLSQSKKGKSVTHSVDELLPITSFSFVFNDPTSFIVAVEGGGLFRCSSLSTKVIAGSDPDFVMNDPVISAYEGHNSHICDVQCSPNQDNIFISCSSDGEIRYYNLNQTSPLQIIQFDGGMVKGLSWSPTQADVFLCWGEDSNLLLYDLSKGPFKPYLPLESNDSHSKVKSAMYNPQSARTIAVADDAGHVTVWNLPEHIDNLSSEDV
ncbi:cytoplasmic dynein 2 intermediate chain 2-like [Hetaerina americana]|uniref:cytoplasmic dynein 2 intermediate chain 2-like n=1 Tax=Hetaerina americana TaxID=62018 RepID=UPI003A7F5C29